MSGLPPTARGTPPTVCIVQRRLTHYRVPLFEALRDELARRDIRLRVLAGQGTPAEVMKNDAGELPWAEPLATRYLAGGRLCWQPMQQHIRDADLVIVTQENKLLHNHLLLVAPRRFRLAFWGHGANLQSGRPDGAKERYKRWTTRRVDWWFAYTGLSADLVQAAGFPADRTTVLNNAIDTAQERQQRRSITPAELQALRDALGFGPGPVGVFVGSLYANKRLDFLFDVAAAIRDQVPDFQLLVVGDGPDRSRVQAACAALPWVRWVGVKTGREKVLHMALAQLMLNPGLVGLGILDAFACGAPLLTTESHAHGPEIAYLDQGVNGLMTANDVGAYAAACVRLLRDPAALDVLRAGCAASADEYTLHNMALRFAEGIGHCLQGRPQPIASNASQA
jgi:glycosyltransferase involved in cell wall biosynthesis